jgi:ankyrin repeat protein
MYLKSYSIFLTLALSTFCLYGMEETSINAKIDAEGNTLLHKAAWENNLDEVRMLLRNPKVDVNAQNSYGSTPLILAMYMMNSSIVDELIKHPALEINKKNLSGQTALDYALIQRSVKLVNAFADMGATVEAGNFKYLCNRDQDFLSKINLPVYSRATYKLFDELNIADCDRFWRSCEQIKIIAIIQDGMVDINAQDSEGNTPLHIACKKGMFEVVLAFLEQENIDIAIKNNQNYTAQEVLCLDYQGMDREVVCLYISNSFDKVRSSKRSLALTEGPNIDLKEKQNLDFLSNHSATEECTSEWGRLSSGLQQTILSFVTTKESSIERILKLLKSTSFNNLDNDIFIANVAKKYVKEHKETVDKELRDAAYSGKIEIVKALIDGGTDINFTGEDPDAFIKNVSPALVQAAENGHFELVKLLLNSGAAVNAQGRNNSTALMNAADNGHKDIVKFLIKAGANVNMQDNSGLTALMLAVYKKSEKIVKLLLDSSADVNICDNFWKTALGIAQQCGFSEIVELLRKY